jgi:DNA repair protein RadC
MPSETDYLLLDSDIHHEYLNAGYVLKVRDMPKQERPREKMLNSGASELSVAELLSIIWGTGSKNEDVLSMAKRTLKEYGEKTLTTEVSPVRLAEIANIPIVKATQVIACFELGRRYIISTGNKYAYVRNAKQAYTYLRNMGMSQKEQLRGLYLNSRYQVIHDEVISVGTLTASVIHPREVFQPAIERGAVAVIIAHNHPSNNLNPSDADIDITKQLIQAASLLGIDLLDHLIITSDRFTSVMASIKKEST